MRSLYLRIYLTVVVVLALFAGISGWLWQRHVVDLRERQTEAVQERVVAWAQLLEKALPQEDADINEQARALREWSQRLRLPLALDDAVGQRIGSSESFLRLESHTRKRGPGAAVAIPILLEDGRTLWLMRAPFMGPGLLPGDRPTPPPWPGGPGMRPPEGLGLLALLVVLFFAIALGAWPVVRRLTRQLEALKQGVERFGGGDLRHRVDVRGRDEVAALAGSFNQAADRIEALLHTHQTLLANASHELRSPLARLKMAVAMWPQASAQAQPALQHEIEVNIRELDHLVEEVLMSSRLDAQAVPPRREPVECLALAAEEGARLDVVAEGEPALVLGDERLLRRALRNLLENARRYGGSEVSVQVGHQPAPAAGGAATAGSGAGSAAARGAGAVRIVVCDRGPGVPVELRERIFEPFFRLPGHAEREGGVGLGLALVRQIAHRHGGEVRCEPREGGGSCFVLTLPAAG